MSSSVTPRTAPIYGSTYARAGEQTFCENGHLLATFKYDVIFGVDAQPSDFDLAPGVSIGISTCPACGGAVNGGVSGAYFFRTSEKE